MTTSSQRVPRLLVVIDNTAEAAVVLERALDLAGALRGELVLLAVECEGPPWEATRRSRKSRRFLAETVQRATLLAATRGIPIAERIEQGDPADVITRTAREEECDQIFMAEPASTLADRALRILTSAFTGRIAERIISSAGVPVTVVAPRTSS